MKNENLKKYSFFALLIILILLSIVVAVIVYFQYPIVPNGIMGIVVIYLMSRLEKQVKFKNSLEDIVLDPKKEKYLIAAFVCPLVYAWSTVQVLEMIIFFFSSK